MIKWMLRLALLVVVAVAVLAYLVTSKLSDRVHWETGQAHIHNATMTVHAGDEHYGASGSVPLWYDRSGTSHEASWPDCLRNGDRSVRFAWVKVEVAGTGFRPIVAVDCRG